MREGVESGRSPGPSASTEFFAFTREQITNYDAKRAVAERLAGLAAAGDVIGGGSGTTAYLALEALAERFHAGDLSTVSILPSSHEVALSCARLGIPIADPMTTRPDWIFDGADEVDPARNLIKGRGGALFREKVLFRSCMCRRIVADSTKFVDRLGTHFPVPVEVAPLALSFVWNELEQFGPASKQIRVGAGKDGPTITESGNLLVDCRFDEIPPTLEVDLKSITGVIESGLFLGYDVELISV